MKRVMTLLVCLSATVAVARQTPSLQDVGGLLPADGKARIYTAREFLTMDAAHPRAQAVAVKDGKFAAVGTLEEVQRAVGSNAEVDRTFDGKIVIAGFVEQHVHPVLAALTMNTKVISIEDWDAIDGFSPAVRDPEGYRKRLVAAVEDFKKANPGNKSKPLVSWGYHHYMHGDDMSRTLLNQLAPDFPMIVWHRSCHEFFLNDAALAAAGIDKALFDAMPASAKAQANWERGHFYEQGALAILGKIAPLMATPEIFKRGLEFSEQYYHRAGITVCAEPGGFPSKKIQDAINAVYSDDETPFNHFFMADGKSLALANQNDPVKLIAESEKVYNWGSGRTAYMPRQVKLLTDGAIFSQLMMMKDGYTDGHHGAWIMDPPVFGYAFQSYWDAGWQIHIHNNGDAGLDVLIGELEKATARNPRKDHRTVLVHFGFARPEQVEKWIELGGIISSNPYYVTALAGRYGTMGMTPKWAENMVPHGDVMRHGGALSFHSDMPMAPAKPMQLVWAGVNRLTYEGQVAGPQHKVPLEAALRAITIEAAYSIQQEKHIGSIEVGKDANLTVLNENPFEVEPAKLKDITVWGTMLEGRVQPLPTEQRARATPPHRAFTRQSNNHVPTDLLYDSTQPAPQTVFRGMLHGPGCGCSTSAAIAAMIAERL